MLGEEHEDTLDSMIFVGISLLGLRRFQEAVTVLQNCLVLSKCLLGEECTDTFTMRDLLAVALAGIEEYDEAVAALQECLTLRQRIQGGEWVETLETMHTLGVHLRYAPQKKCARLPLVRICIEIGRFKMPLS